MTPVRKYTHWLSPAIWLVLTSSSHATAIWNSSPAPIVTTTGQFASGAQAFFYTAGTTTPISLFYDSALTNPQPNPAIADQNGVFAPVYFGYGNYRVRVVDQNGVLISDRDNIDNIAPPSAGSGITVTQDMVFQTGDAIWRLRVGQMAGWVRMNGNTIGSATSGATELANASTQNLFIYLWTNFSNSIAPVSGGRGASASADFAANKTIGIPSMQGMTAAGLDDMGANGAGILQAITTCTTNSTAVITVASAAGIAVGMNAIIGGTANGTVTTISGTTVTLSTPVGSSGSGVSARFSLFADATGMGNSAGSDVLVQTVDGLAAHNHAITDPGHHHTYTAVGGSGAAAGGITAGATGGTTGNSTTGITINSNGSGNPMNTLPPARLGTFYMKL